MGQLDRLRIWDDPAIREALAWYLDVAENRRPAKFRIAATVGVNIDPPAATEDALWAELDRLTPSFLARWKAIRAGAALPKSADGPSLLEVGRELAYRMLAHCNFCPWDCRVSCSIAARLGRGPSFLPPATCAAPSVRTATSARTGTTARRSTPARWRPWHGCSAERDATT